MTNGMDVLDRRRENLRRYCANRFEGNRAALARTAVVHQNQVNLMLTANEKIRRPMTEQLARKMERNLSLPEGYFDQVPLAAPREGIASGALVVAPAVMEELLPVLSTCEGITSITITPAWLNAHHIADPARLWLATMACDGLSPQINHGETLVLESVMEDHARPQAGKGFTRDGNYLLATKGGPIFRRVQRTVDGFLLSSPNPAYAPEPKSTLKSVVFYARVVGALRFQ